MRQADRLKFLSVTGERSRGTSGRSAAGSASPCQGEGRGFESRRPLGEAATGYVRGQTRWSGREARQRPAKPCTRVQIPSPPRHDVPRAIGAAGARFLDTEEVTGSIPVSPTRVYADQRLVTRSSVTSRSRCVPYGGSKMGAQDQLANRPSVPAP